MSDRRPGPRRLLAQRLRPALVRFVRTSVDGPEVDYADAVGPGVTVAQPSYALPKTVRFFVGKNADVTVGRYSLVHRTVTILRGGEHRTSWVGMVGGHWADGTFVPAEGGVVTRGPVTIGSDVWIGYEALVRSGVTIGDGAVVGARAVVSRDVEPYEIVAGNPLQHVRYRFDEATREALLRIRWWDWDEQRVGAHWHEIASPDVAAFVAKHDPQVATSRD